MSEHDAKGAAAEEAAKTLTYVAILAVALPVLAWIERASSSPDTMRLLRMRAAKGAERFCATTAGAWWMLAERARLLYESERA